MCPRGCNQSERRSAYLNWKQSVQRAAPFGDTTFNIQICNATAKVGLKYKSTPAGTQAPPLFPRQHKPKPAGKEVPRMTFCLMPNEIRAKSKDVQFTRNDSLPGSHLTAGERIKEQQQKEEKTAVLSSKKVALRVKRRKRGYVSFTCTCVRNRRLSHSWRRLLAAALIPPFTFTHLENHFRPASAEKVAAARQPLTPSSTAAQV